MKPFDYHMPATLLEASEVWAEHRGAARLLAGGTDLNVALRHGHIATDHVIDLKRVDALAPDISRVGRELRVSAGTTMTMLGTYLSDHGLLPALVEATAVVGSIQIRNRATLAGSKSAKTLR